MVLFKDINKSSSDILNKDFPHDKTWDIEFKHSNKNPQFTQNAAVASSGAMEASSTIKYVVKDATIEGKFGNTGAGFVDVKLAMDNFVKGLTFGARNERRTGKAASDVLQFSSEYFSPAFHGKLQVEPVSASWALNGVATYKNEDFGRFKIGGEVSGALEMSSLKYAVGGAFVGEDKMTDSFWTVSVKTAPQDGAVFGKLYGNVHVAALKSATSGTSPGPAELGAEVQYSFVDQKTSLSFGGLWYLDATRDNFIKSKLNADGKVNVSMTQKLSEIVSATLGVQFDGLKGSHADNMKYGLKLRVRA